MCHRGLWPQAPTVGASGFWKRQFPMRSRRRRRTPPPGAAGFRAPSQLHLDGGAAAAPPGPRRRACPVCGRRAEGTGLSHGGPRGGQSWTAGQDPSLPTRACAVVRRLAWAGGAQTRPRPLRGELRSTQSHSTCPWPPVCGGQHAASSPLLVRWPGPGGEGVIAGGLAPGTPRAAETVALSAAGTRRQLRPAR